MDVKAVSEDGWLRANTGAGIGPERMGRDIVLAVLPNDMSVKF